MAYLYPASSVLRTAMHAEKNGNYAFGGGVYTTTPVWTVIYDASGSAMNATTGVYTAPFTGYYTVTCTAFVKAPWVLGRSTVRSSSVQPRCRKTPCRGHRQHPLVGRGC
jgi:hypothetical protein